MSESTTQERTEPASPKRKEDSKKKGQVPRSKELNTFTSLIASGLGIYIYGDNIVDGLKTSLTNNLTFTHEQVFSDSYLSTQMLDAVSVFLIMLSPLFLIVVISALVTPLSLGGAVFNMSLLMPKFERISPFKGVQRIFSSKSLMELLKAIIKFVLVASVFVLVMMMIIDEILMLSLKPLAEAIGTAGNLIIYSFFGFTMVLIIVVIMDIPYQVWDHNRQIKMTKQEVKEEQKETDGRPEVKSAIRDRQQQMSRQRMMADVPEADVVITNPTHFSIALKYDQNKSGAPKVVAKGRGIIASRIKEIAIENNIVLFSAPPLARALYVSTEIGEEIPENLFIAVAQILAYVFQLRDPRNRAKTKAQKPNNIVVPDDYFNHPLLEEF